MDYTIKPAKTGGYDIVDADHHDAVIGHYAIVEDAATRLTEILRPDLDPKHQVAFALVKLRDEVYANVDTEFARRIELNKTDPISI